MIEAIKDPETWLKLMNMAIVIIVTYIVAWLAYYITKKWLSKIIIKIAGKTATNWDDLMFSKQFFNRMALLIVPIVVKYSLSNWFTIADDSVVWDILESWIVLAVVMFISAILNGGNRIYNSYPISKNRPISVFIQIIKVFLYCFVGIIIVSIFIGESPTSLLVGMSAFAAVLMLIFKDTILGFVAGIQLMSNKMLHIGDWITMDSCKADGDVMEINLTTVKVQNFDKTIVTIPTYKMVSESFINWRGMYESNGRRIKRSININIHSIHYLSSDEIEALKKSSLLASYINGKISEISAYNEQKPYSLDKRQLTNIGTFREYIEAWISSNTSINQGMTHMVRQLQPGPTGVPLEIYCFAANQDWISYERIQADIFDHIFAVLPLFNLEVYEYGGVVDNLK